LIELNQLPKKPLPPHTTSFFFTAFAILTSIVVVLYNSLKTFNRDVTLSWRKLFVWLHVPADLLEMPSSWLNNPLSQDRESPLMTKQLQEDLGKAWEAPKTKRQSVRPARLSESNIKFSPQPSPTTSARFGREPTKEPRKPFESPKKFVPPARREPSPIQPLTMSSNKSNRRVKVRSSF
jgi:hypothetical protein